MSTKGGHFWCPRAVGWITSGFKVMPGSRGESCTTPATDERRHPSRQVCPRRAGGAQRDQCCHQVPTAALTCQTCRGRGGSRAPYRKPQITCQPQAARNRTELVEIGPKTVKTPAVSQPNLVGCG